MPDPLRNYEDFAKSLRNFESWLGDAAPGGMDLDFIIERKGRFLVFEAKPWKNGVALPYGQHLCLYSLSKLPVFRVYLVGEAPDSLYMVSYNGALAPHIGKYRGRLEAWWKPERFVPTSPEGLRQLVRGWWQEATEAAA